MQNSEKVHHVNPHRPLPALGQCHALRAAADPSLRNHNRRHQRAMKTQFIQTPYGPKRPELLIKAMDALEREPKLLAALRDIADAAYGTDTPKLRERARAALAKATKS